MRPTLNILSDTIGAQVRRDFENVFGGGNRPASSSEADALQAAKIADHQNRFDEPGVAADE